MKKIFSTVVSLLLLINLSSSVTVLADTSSNKEDNNASVSSEDINNETINNDTNASSTEPSKTTVADEDNSVTDKLESSSTDTFAAIPTNVTYQTHVSNIGWQIWVNSGEMAGTTGKSLPVEALKLSLTNKVNGVTLKYQTHVSHVGWQSWVNSGEMAGTTGKSLPVEAIKISLEGLSGYSVQYQVHIKNVGWQNWVSDGEMAGSTGKSLPIEAIRVRIVKTVHPQSITINKDSLTLSVGGSETLTQTLMPSDTTNDAVTWSSSKSNVASIDSFGKVKALSVGTSIITCTSNDGNLTATCTINVDPVSVKGISINKTSETIYVGKKDTLQTTITPSNATNKNIEWTSSDSSIATVDDKGVVTGIKEGTAIIKAVSEDGNHESSCNVTVKSYNPSINYKGYCQNIGWQSSYSNGATAGTIGKGLRMEAISISLSDVPSGAAINYQVYVQNKGWMKTVSNGTTAGTSNQSLRIEALKINLSNLPGYTVEYRTYIQNKGWQPWVTNGNISGTLGRSLRVEAIQIQLKKSVSITYNTFQQNRGWTGNCSNSAISSTNGQPLRIEAFYAKLNDAPQGAYIQYQAYVQTIGWQDYVSNGSTAGTSGKSLRIEAIRANLVNLPGYTLQYQVFVQTKGWSDWINAGNIAGTMGSSLRIEGLRMRVIANPEATALAKIDQTLTALKIATYLDSTENIKSVNAKAVALHGGITVNNCVYFSSESLRRIGFPIPNSMCDTGSYTRYLADNGFVKNYDIDKLRPGDLCFSINGSYGYPTHVYVFMGWVNPDDHSQAYVADNQASTIHIRSMIQTSVHDAFAYSMHK